MFKIQPIALTIKFEVITFSLIPTNDTPGFLDLGELGECVIDFLSELGVFVDLEVDGDIEFSLHADLDTSTALHSLCIINTCLASGIDRIDTSGYLGLAAVATDQVLGMAADEIGAEEAGSSHIDLADTDPAQVVDAALEHCEVSVAWYE